MCHLSFPAGILVCACALVRHVRTWGQNADLAEGQIILVMCPCVVTASSVMLNEGRHVLSTLLASLSRSCRNTSGSCFNPLQFHGPMAMAKSMHAK